MPLRGYQLSAISEIEENFKSGKKKVLLHLSTGAGKTVIFCELLRRVALKGNSGGMIVRGKQLVDQASQRLFREYVDHGVIQANHWNKNRSAKIQVCSIDTLIRRKMKPDWKILVIDEAHLATTGNYKKFIESYGNDVFVLAVTATPYGKHSLSHLADTVVRPVTLKQLIDMGYLVPPRYFAPSIPDLKGVKIKKGDYVNDELHERMNCLTGDIVEHYKELGQNRPAILFAVNINHSKDLADRFRVANIPALHIEANTSMQERKEAIKKLEQGEIKVLCNVGVLCTGVDIPSLGCVILARPTKSYNLYIQQLGRGTRPFENKKDFIVLDHSGNVMRHGFITDEPEVDLNGNKKIPDLKKLKTCKKCYAIFSGMHCPFGCKTELTIMPERSTVQIEGKLIEISEMPLALEIKQFIEKMKTLQKSRGYKRGWLFYKVKEKYGDDVANKFFPKRELPWFIKRTH